jgi:hypothetical protein
MKTNFIENNRNKVVAILMVFFVLLLFGNAPADESTQQPSKTGKYQALFLGEDKLGFHIILIMNTETGNVEKRIFYDELTDHQAIYNFVTKEITTITRKPEKTN